MLVSLTVGKVDAGVAVLLTEDKRLIEFPSILLPPHITSGSIVDITVSRNKDAEVASATRFASLQSHILSKYGLHAPSPPTLRLRNATQTSVVLEWDPINLATSNLRSLALYRNGSKAGTIPRPLEMLATKISGLAVDTEYSFALVLRTSGGTYSSETLTVRTHKMTDLSGIVVTAGVLPTPLRESVDAAVSRIGGRVVEGVKIETTHFVCTEGRGRDWERAVEMSIPVVRPEWVEGCEREGKIVGVRGYYLDANPKDRQVGSNPAIPQHAGSKQGSASAAGQGSHTSLPSRGGPQRAAVEQAEDTPQDSPVVGEPGPELPPTPPPKSSPARQAEVPPRNENGESDGSAGDSSTSPSAASLEEGPRKPARSFTEMEDEQKEKHARAERPDGQEGSAEMEDVSL